MKASAEGLDLTWKTEAACRGADRSLFFPGPSDPQAPAKEYCARCPVRRACLEYSIAAPELAGIWGGLGETKRKKIISAGDRDRAIAEVEAQWTA